MGKDGVELLAQILELGRRGAFREDVLNSPIVFGGVADSGERNSSRLLLLDRLEVGEEPPAAACVTVANLFGVAPRLACVRR